MPRRLSVTLSTPVALAVFVAWMLLAGYALVRLIIGLVRLEQLKRDALPLPVEYRDAMPQWGRANKGARDVRLCVSDETDVPVAVGLFDAMILIPHSLLDRLSEGEVDQICLHELAHLRRADDWTNGLQRVINALLAWNPAAQFMGQQLDLEREVACDDWVLSLVGMVRPYALCLTKMAEGAAWPRNPIPAPGVFATRKHISLRIERLLGAGRNIATNLAVVPAAAAVAAVAAVALVIAVVAPSIAAPSVPIAAHPQATPAVAASAKPVRETIVDRVTRTETAAIPTHPPVQPRPAVSPVVHVPPTSTHVGPLTVHVPRIAIKTPEIDVPVPLMAPKDTKELAQSIEKEVNRDINDNLPLRAGPSHVALSGASCSGCNFANVDWSGKDLHGVHYTGVDLSGAKLVGTNFSGGNFSGVDFSGANLSNASFRNARLTGCDFSKANLNGVDFTGARLSGGQFTNAQLTSAALRDVLNTCSGCDFTKADLRGLDLSNIRANGDDFTKADLRGTNFSGASLTGIDFSHARMDGANLAGATLNGSDLTGVDLTHVDLSHAKLIGTDLSGSQTPP